MGAGDNLTDVIARAIRNRLADLHTSMPAQIISYDFRTQKANVQPTINRRYADSRIEKYPPINNVPVIFPRSGGASLTFPVKPGDPVLLIFCGRSLDGWLNRGGIVDQDDNRMHSLNDAVAIPGLLPFPTGSLARNNEDALLTYGNADVEIKQDSQINVRNKNASITITAGGEVTVDASKDITLNSATRVEVSAPIFRVDAGAYEFAGGNGSMQGDLVVQGEVYDHNQADGSLGTLRTTYNGHDHNESIGSVTDQPNQQEP